jgi:hypothetical protein
MKILEIQEKFDDFAHGDSGISAIVLIVTGFSKGPTLVNSCFDKKYYVYRLT